MNLQRHYLHLFLDNVISFSFSLTHRLTLKETIKADRPTDSKVDFLLGQ